MPDAVVRPVESTQAAKAEPATPPHSYLAKIYFLSSMTQGVISTGLFNPFYRALFLAQIHDRAYWRKPNFNQPWQGGLQAMALKCLFGSTFYAAQDEGRMYLLPHLNKLLGLFLRILASDFLPELSMASFDTRRMRLNIKPGAFIMQDTCKQPGRCGKAENHALSLWDGSNRLFETQYMAAFIRVLASAWIRCSDIIYQLSLTLPSKANVWNSPAI